MTRVEELAFKFADGRITDPEQSELVRLVADPQAARIAIGALELEAALRAGRRVPDLGPLVVDRLRRERAERTRKGVMDRIRSGSPPSWLKPRRSRWSAGIAAAALFAVVLGSLLGSGPSVATLEGDAILRRAGEERAASPGMALFEGDEIRALSRLVIRYRNEETRLEVEPLSELALGYGRSGKRVELRRGEISAIVAPQKEGPMMIESPHGRAEVLGTRLKLSAAEDATRLEVEEGRVRLVRAPDGAAVEVTARHFSVAGGEMRLRSEPVVAPSATPPRVVGFSLIRTDTPRSALPGFEELADGAVLRRSKLPVKRINIQAHTDPPRIGSLRFSYAGNSNFNTELIWPYTLIPNDGTDWRTWKPAPGIHRITVTPFTGTYGNGVAGESQTLTITVVDE